MFDVSWSELLVIAVAALIFIGPKELPGVLRSVGQWSGKIRRMAAEFQDQFREAMREAEMADLKKEIDETTSKLGSGLDPLAEFKDIADWKPTETSTAPAPVTPPSADAPPAPPAEATTAEPAHSAPHAAPAPATAGETPPAAAPPAGGDRAA
jgi:sec-independent protein translocase protein TatB